MITRTGIGYDVHRLVEGRDLVIGGVKIDCEKGLEGHSDADVLAHAVMDALLGAVSEGDIGEHFPSGDIKYKDADSLELLAKVAGIVARKGYAIVNVDATVVADAPRLSGYREEMRDRLAKAMLTVPSNVNVKFTTAEGLGFEGRGEGISAQAVATVMSIPSGAMLA